MSIGWNERLAAHPLLADLRHWELGRWAKAADEVEFEPGDVLLSEDRIGYWFFLLHEGTVERRKDGVAIGRFGPGDHFGEEATIAFRPQPATIVAQTRVRAFVVGRRHLLPLVDDQVVVRRRLFPGVGDHEFVTKLRELRAAADLEWQAIGRERLAKLTKESEARSAERRPGRAVRSGSTLAALTTAILSRQPALAGRPADIRTTLGWRGRLVLTSVVSGAILAAGLLYHPPIVVVTAMQPIDATKDITVRGAPTYPVTGRYLLLPVRFDRPNAFGALIAVIEHRRRVPVAGAMSRADARIAAQEAESVFRLSQKEAAAAAARAAEIPFEPGGELPFQVTFKRRVIGGPSGGLVYALALADMLSPEDLAGGRTIAATGGIDLKGGVNVVGFIGQKADSAEAARAAIFLVPSKQARDAERKTVAVRGVRSLRDAMTWLRISRPRSGLAGG